MIEEDTRQGEPSLDAWQTLGPEEAPGPRDALVVDVAGFEGPLDLLLALARTQKVDLAKISMLALAQQYLAFVTDAQRLRLELAADYLVMAAWLAYLKSRLLLPRDSTADNEPTGEDLAQRLAFRLMRLDAMRRAAAQLMTRRRLGRDVFGRGMPEGARTIRERQYSAQIYDLLKAYAEQRSRGVKRVHVVKARAVWSIKEARQRLERLVGRSTSDWVQLDSFLDRYLPAAADGRTVLASSFGATLEMAREGLVEIRQEAPFAPIYMRKKNGRSVWERIALRFSEG